MGRQDAPLGSMRQLSFEWRDGPNELLILRICSRVIQEPSLISFLVAAESHHITMTPKMHIGLRRGSSTTTVGMCAGTVLNRWNMKKSLLIVIALSLNYLGCGLCGEEIKHEVKSPNGKYVATVFERNCGATTPYITHLNLRESGEDFKPNSNGVIVQGEVYTVKGQSEIKVTWSTELSILIETIGGQEVLGKEKTWNEVTISYK